MALIPLLLLVGLTVVSGESTQSLTNSPSVEDKTAPMVDFGFAGYQGFVDPQLTLMQSDKTAPIVDLGYARYQGFVENNLTHFFGVRYAAPPLGDLRFQAPQAPVESPDVQQANSQPPNCPWGFTTFVVPGAPVYPHDEDCLFLNVYVPGVIDPSKKLPVVVWIHGGAYMVGGLSGYGLTYIQRGDDLVRESGGEVVVVAIQYRLGLFGFLSGERVKASGALNAGLLDQEHAFRWVQEHAQYEEIVTLANCSSSRDTFQCLQTSDFDVLQSVYLGITKKALSTGTYAFVPVVDGTFIAQRPTQALQQGKVNGEALYAVFNTFEGSIFFLDPSTADAIHIPDYVGTLFPKLSMEERSAAAAIYAGLGSPEDQAIAIMGEATFICPTYYILRAFPGHAYKGEFAIPPGIHGMDLGYYFPWSNLAGVPDYNNTDFSTAFADSFLTFAKTLDPNNRSGPNNITPLWATWAPGNDEMLFNKTEDGAPVVKSFKTSKALLDRCTFWESVSANTPQ